MAEKEQFNELENVEIKPDEEIDNSYSQTFDGKDYISLTQIVDTDSFKGNVTPNAIRKLAQIYGNNIFALSVDSNAIIGVLKTLPPISMSSNWSKTALTSLQQKILSLQTNVKFQWINAILGAQQVPMIAGGSATTRMYKDCSRPEFNLEFRVYSTEAIGPASILTGYTKTLAMLCLYSPALHTMDATGILSTALKNISNTLVTGLDALIKGEEYLNSKLNNSDAAPDSEETSVMSQGMSVVNDFKTLITGGNTDNDAAKTAARKEAAKSLTEDFTKAADAIGKFLSKNTEIMHTDVIRVADETNYSKGIYGGAIWNLTVLPGILNHNIPVYVQSWNAKPSKEIDAKGNSLYYDFTVHCVMDQIKSANWWLNVINDNDFAQYKLTPNTIKKS